MIVDKHLIEDYMESEINSSKIHRLTDKLVELENEIMKELNDKQKDLFWKYMECEDKRTCAEIDYALHYGFAYAITLIKELLGEKF